MFIKTAKIEKSIEVQNGKVASVTVKNLVSGNAVSLHGEEFIISYRKKEKGLFLKHFSCKASDCFLEEKGTTLLFIGKGEDATEFAVIVNYSADGDVVSKTLTLSANAEIFLECVRQDVYQIPNGFSWSRVMPSERVYVPRYIMTLGQPVYFGSLFTAYKSPVGDNKIENGELYLGYHIGRPLQKDFNGSYTTRPVVLGSAADANLNACRAAFYNYVYTFSKKPTFYITFNSWYDDMLDIDSAKIASSFRNIHDGFQESGLRDIDCYVVDDGWVDYGKEEFWGFVTQKFPNQFENESKLTKELGSKFGVWFGPRGGYTEASRYGKTMRKLGYGFCKESNDICTAHPKYIHDLGDKLMDFMRKYNVEYFKLDGFACRPCSDRSHGHPVGGESGLYFYTYLWEEWCKVFQEMKKVNENVFINLTSYAHCTPFFLEYVSAIWMNNASDMGYIGEGSNLDQCLNYRDSRYYDLQHGRELQLPSQYIYNHEPNYGVRNFNPPLPSPSHKTVTYTDAEFESYLYGCMMRGSGFIELYYSPSLMEEGEKYKINARVLGWAEKNFKVISNSIYIGESPLKGEIYGYIGTDEKDAVLYLRNPSKSVKTAEIDLSAYTFLDGTYNASMHYPEEKPMGKMRGNFKVTLEPKCIAVYIIHYED